MESAEEIIVLGDGANWIWNRIAAMFPRHKSTEILDFYHAGEYVWDAGKAILGETTDKTKAWGEKYCHILKHKGPDPVLQELQALSLASKTTPEPVTKAITYFENQSPRMNYPYPLNKLGQVSVDVVIGHNQSAGESSANQGKRQVTTQMSSSVGREYVMRHE